MQIIISNYDSAKQVSIVFEKEDISKNDISDLEKLLLEPKDRLKRVTDFFIHIELAAATAERITLITEPKKQVVTL